MELVCKLFPFLIVLQLCGAQIFILLSSSAADCIVNRSACCRVIKCGLCNLHGSEDPDMTGWIKFFISKFTSHTDSGTREFHSSINLSRSDPDLNCTDINVDQVHQVEEPSLELFQTLTSVTDIRIWTLFL